MSKNQDDGGIAGLGQGTLLVASPADPAGLKFGGAVLWDLGV